MVSLVIIKNLYSKLCSSKLKALQPSSASLRQKGLPVREGPQPLNKTIMILTRSFLFQTKLLIISSVQNYSKMTWHILQLIFPSLPPPPSTWSAPPSPSSTPATCRPAWRTWCSCLWEALQLSQRFALGSLPQTYIFVRKHYILTTEKDSTHKVTWKPPRDSSDKHPLSWDPH